MLKEYQKGHNMPNYMVFLVNKKLLILIANGPPYKKMKDKIRTTRDTHQGDNYIYTVNFA